METQNTDGGGGTPLSICAISPTDTEGTLWNFLKRIEELEKAVSQMLGGNIRAGQLSDLSQQVGWVYGITYMGVPGWTQTEYGSLIPPAGWTMSSSGFTLSDGNTYQGLSLDSDGVLQFGFTDSGGVSGELPQAWNLSSFQDYSYYAFGPSLSPNPQSGTSGITVISNSFGVFTDYSGGIVFHIAQAGLYSVSVNADWVTNGVNSGAFAMIPHLNIEAGSGINHDNKLHLVLDTVGYVTDSFMGTGVADISFSGTALGFISSSPIVKLAIGDEVSVSLDINTLGSGSCPSQFEDVSIYITRVSGVT